MKNVAEIKNCYGCGVCAISCGKKIIDIHLNENGFYEPRIDNPEECTGCQLCINVCSFCHDQLSLETGVVGSYAAWSNDDDVRKKCSSGGIAFEIEKELLEQGYKICAVRFNVDKNQAEHYIAETKEELIQSVGSKYIQSYTVEGFGGINKKEKYLVVGTPCQIDSFRRYIKKHKCEDNFVLMDFFCHGVTSKYLWDKYAMLAEKKVGRITYASWRNKFEYGWHDSWIMGIDGENTSKPVDWHDSYNLLIKEKKSFIQSRWSQGDLFYRLFLGHACLGSQCEKACKYKYDKSSADIRIGDLWGNTFKDNEKGVSALVTFTQVGETIIKSLQNAHIEDMSFELVAESQMKKNAKPITMKPVFMTLLRSKYCYPQWIYDSLFLISRVIERIKRIK